MAYRWTEDDLATLQRRSSTQVPAVASSTKSKRQKFLNVKTTDAQGIVHDGKGECERWQELQLLERAGAITRLCRQVVYAFVDNGRLVTTYKADFDYYDGAAHIVEDHKSPRTRKLESYRHKVKLMQSQYGIQIREVTK
jgi:hypothetical protein